MTQELRATSVHSEASPPAAIWLGTEGHSFPLGSRLIRCAATLMLLRQFSLRRRQRAVLVYTASCLTSLRSPAI